MAVDVAVEIETVRSSGDVGWRTMVFGGGCPVQRICFTTFAFDIRSALCVGVALGDFALYRRLVSLKRSMLPW